MSSLPKPQYTIWQAISASLAASLRALDEVRALSRLPGPQGERGEAGPDGRSVKTASIEDGSLVLEFTDGHKEVVGNVIGPPGKDGASIKGERGEPGKDGKRGPSGKDGTPGASQNNAVGDVFRASLTAKDIDRLMVREITINGETIQVLVPK